MKANPHQGLVRGWGFRKKDGQWTWRTGN